MPTLITVLLILAGCVCFFLGLMLIINQAAKGMIDGLMPRYPVARWVGIILLFLLAALCFWMAFGGPLTWREAQIG